MSRQIIFLSEHNLFTLKEKGTQNIHIFTVRAWIMPTLFAMGWHAVYDCGISWPYSFIFDTIVIVDDNTIVLHKIELKICTKQIKYHPITRDKSHKFSWAL